MHARCSRIPRLLAASLAAAALAAGCAPPPDSAIEETARPLAIKKTFTRKIYVHMMPWFQVGGLHWSLNSRNAATGVASWYAPMIGEYSSNDPVVIEYQLLTMKYAGIDGVLVDWPGLNGANDLPQNKASAEAIIDRTAAFGLEFGIVYEDQDAVSVDAAKNDLAYARDNYFGKPNYIKVNGAPGLLVFGPQKFTNPADWTNILSVLATKPTLFSLWYNANAGSNAQGQFAWVAQNGLKGVSDFDNGLDGGNHGLMIPVLYPGFNPYYAAGGWPGPTWKISYTLKPDNTEGGDTFASTFSLGMYAGDPLQIATWNDYGEGTMVEPTNQLQYRFLTTLQQNVGATYTDAELKIVKMLYDQRRQLGASKQAQLDQASAALANLDVAMACGILGCTVPVHGGAGGAGTAGSGSTGAGGGAGAAGAKGTAGAPGTAGVAGTGAAGSSTTSTGAAGHAGSSGAAGGSSSGGAGSSANGGAGASPTGHAGAGGSAGKPAAKGASGCSVSGADAPSRWPVLALGIALAAARRRPRRGATSVETTIAARR
jgi:MYXO-CTERM domain-containing protein